MIVQIPLWTIVTFKERIIYMTELRSDSSMDDCNPAPLAFTLAVRRVQIPLWTIVTLITKDFDGWYNKFRFLYGRL